MSANATFWAWKQDLSSSQKLVLLALANCHNQDTGRCFPSVDYLADVTCLNPKTVRKSLSELEARGLLLRISRPSTSTSYVMNTQVVYKKPAINRYSGLQKNFHKGSQIWEGRSTKSGRAGVPNLVGESKRNLKLNLKEDPSNSQHSCSCPPDDQIFNSDVFDNTQDGQQEYDELMTGTNLNAEFKSDHTSSQPDQPFAHNQRPAENATTAFTRQGSVPLHSETEKALHGQASEEYAAKKPQAEATEFHLTEDSQPNLTDTVSQKPKTSKTGKPKKKVLYNDHHLALAQEMAIPVKAEFPTQKIKIEEWADAIRKLMELDRIPESRIRKLWTWIRHHGDSRFSWNTNCRTPMKLRKFSDGIPYFDLIERQMDQETARFGGVEDDYLDYITGDKRNDWALKNYNGTFDEFNGRSLLEFGN